MILVLDNYDSFVYNLVQYLGMLGSQVCVVRNDCISLSEIASAKPSAILISPGPCGPDQAGISVETVRAYAGHIPILGICLGHQAIARAYEATVQRASVPMHGKTSLVSHLGAGVFAGLPKQVRVCRYHSLSVAEESLPAALVPVAWASDGELMAIEDQQNCVYGIQFHPESLYTECGFQMMQNFLRCAELFWAAGHGGTRR
ncbi:MAG: anthranilate synthase component [Bacilli bacterium]|nr:anthranilate synthase component [Bacilli bacterium]